jgi:DNA-binding NarL/FixJ family response regulator
VPAAPRGGPRTTRDSSCGRGAREANGNGLTPRQRQIASLIADGLSNKQIARSLCIERATVKNHVHAILIKLGITRRDQVAARLHT